MSQFFLNTNSVPPPPVVATSYVTQDGTAVPAANILIVNGFDSTENNDNGIITKGGVVGTGTSNEVDVVLTNRITGSATTTDDITVTTVSSFNLGSTPGTYLFSSRLVAYNTTDITGAGYYIFGVYRTDGVSATHITGAPGIIGEEGTMSGVLTTFGFSGNNATITVNGLAGKTINWRSLSNYTFVG